MPALHCAHIPFSGKRIQEIICFCMGISLMAVNFVLMVKYLSWEAVPSMVLCALLGMLSADLSSGIVHWAADTWGSIDMPILGKVSWPPTYR